MSAQELEKFLLCCDFLSCFDTKQLLAVLWKYKRTGTIAIGFPCDGSLSEGTFAEEVKQLESLLSDLHLFWRYSFVQTPSFNDEARAYEDEGVFFISRNRFWLLFFHVIIAPSKSLFLSLVEGLLYGYPFSAVVSYCFRRTFGVKDSFPASLLEENLYPFLLFSPSWDWWRKEMYMVRNFKNRLAISMPFLYQQILERDGL